MEVLSVLIVEDEGLIALHLQELLEKAGYNVLDLVPSGEEAIEYVKTFPAPDLIFMDITLDGRLDGIETAREILTRFKIPIIFLTAHSETNRLARVKDLLSCRFIAKPFTYSEIVSGIEKALGR